MQMKEGSGSPNFFIFSLLPLQVADSQPAQGANMNGKVRVRYMENKYCFGGFFLHKTSRLQRRTGSHDELRHTFRGNLELVLSTNYGPGGAAKPMSDGRKAEPGGWNRIILSVDNLQAEVAKLKQDRLHFRNEIVSGPGGSEILLDDPSGNPVELFQSAC